VIPPRRPYLLLSLVAAAYVMAAAPAHAFEDGDFCVAARQFALAAEKDVGLWIDRATRDAGMVVFCEKNSVEFKRFTYLPSVAMNDTWKEQQATAWNASRCTSAVWSEAISYGWKIVLNITSADGRQVSLAAQCR
jgi:hypothetical protein